MSRYKAKSSAQVAIVSFVPLSSPSSQRSIPNLLLRDPAAMAPKKATVSKKGKAVMQASEPAAMRLPERYSRRRHSPSA
jgi:hypothetical protein